MAEALLYAIIEGSIDPLHVINAIKSGRFEHLTEELKDLDSRTFLQDFVPHFLIFVKDKLSKNLTTDQLLSCSPKRPYISVDGSSRYRNKSCTNLESRFENEGKNWHQNKVRSLSVDIFDTNGRYCGTTLSLGSSKKQNSSFRPKYAKLNSSQVSNNSTTSQVSSVFTDVSSESTPSTSTPQLSRQNQKRRITPTLVTPEKGTFHEKEEIRKLFEASPVIEAVESSFDSSGSMSENFPFNRKVKGCQKPKRGKKRNEVPFSAFISNGEILKSCSDQRLTTDNNMNTTMEPSTVVSDKATSRDLSGNVDVENMSKEINITETEDHIFKRRIPDIAQMMAFVEIYASMLMENLVSNIIVELYFLYSVVNCNQKLQSRAEVDEVIFDSVESCVYFAAKVLEKAKALSLVFDMATLSVITQNKRLNLLAPDLVEFANKRLSEMRLQDTSSDPQLSFSSSLGVPFQMEGNNRKLFSSDRYFSTFSKMRDKFYGLLRKWEENHLKHDWSVERELGQRFQTFFSEFLEFPVYSQFCQLFIAQLLEISSQEFSGLQNRDDVPSSGLLEYLKSTNPAKFQRLQERFFSPMISQGPCPKPGFSDFEFFFKLFIDRSCNFYFMVHLRDTLTSRILAINSIDCAPQYGNSEEVDENHDTLLKARNDYSIHLREAKILSKFLGYITFLPYELDDQSKNQGHEALRNDVITQPFDPYAILTESVSKGRLIITIPWLVQYLSYMNETSLKLNVNHSVLCQLTHIYRSPTLRCREVTLNGMFILFHLGWLFEQPLISAHSPFYKLLNSDSACEGKDLYNWGSSGSIDFISKSLLIRFCPYINEIKGVLSKTGSGSLRKIKPLTHIDKVTVVDTEKILRENMIQDFFKYKPKYFKETSDFIIERFCANLKLSINGVLTPAFLKDATETLKKSIIIDEGEYLEIERLKEKNSAFFKQMLSLSKPELEAKMQVFCDGYCTENSEDIVAKMLPVNVDHRVVRVAAKIISCEVKHKMKEWISSNINSQYENELNLAFHKLLMSEVKKTNKSLDNSLT